MDEKEHEYFTKVKNAKNENLNLVEQPVRIRYIIPAKLNLIINYLFALFMYGKTDVLGHNIYQKIDVRVAENNG